MKRRKSRQTGLAEAGTRHAAQVHSPEDGDQAALKLTHHRRRLALLSLLLGLLTLLAYANSFGVPMILDNRGLLLEDPRIRAATGGNLALIFSHTYWWPTVEAGLYRPLTTLSYLFNYAILGNGTHVAGYHAINLLLHIGNVLLVFAVGRTLLGELMPSALLAAMWAVHPASTEAVTNIIGRSDLLAALAVLSGLLLFLKSTKTTGWRRIALLAGLGVATAAGVYSKESAVMIAGVIALYCLTWRTQRRWQDLLFGLAAVAVPTAVMLIQRAAVLASSRPAEFPFTDDPIGYTTFLTGRLTALSVMGRYLMQAIWPWRLSVDYSYSEIPLVTGSLAMWITAGLTLLAFLSLLGLWRWNRTAFFLASFAVVTFLPVSNLLLTIGTIRADRFLYLPTIGVLGCLVLAAFALASRIGISGVAPAILLLMTALFAVRTSTRNAEWRDEQTLAGVDLGASPHSFKLHKLMGATLFAADPSHANIDRVVDEFDRSLAIVNSLPDRENVPDLYDFAGAAYLAKGDRVRTADTRGAETAYRRSRELLERSIRIHQAQGSATSATDAEAYRQLSAVSQRLGETHGALREAGEALRINPSDPELYRQAANLYLAQGNGDEAAVTLLEGILITLDRGLRSDLVRLYSRSKDLAACALVEGPDGPAPNPQCGIVRNHMCTAAPEILKTAGCDRQATGRLTGEANVYERLSVSGRADP